MMSTIVPMAPPLPPLDTKSYDKRKATSCDTFSDADTKEALKQWEHLHCSEGEKLLTVWTNTPASILQDGPQCGLVALTMAGKSLGVPIETVTLLNQAQNIGISKQGELFSATGLCRLANCFNLNATLDEGCMNDIHFIIKLLSCGKLLLVPYDADFNHQPCQKKGHKAHWALIFGFMVLADRIEDFHSRHHLETLGPNIYRIRNNDDRNDHRWAKVEKDRVFLLAKQGKSKRVGIWSFNSLADSNANLYEVDPKRNSHLDYILPSDNKLIDLCGKVVVIG